MSGYFVKSIGVTLAVAAVLSGGLSAQTDVVQVNAFKGFRLTGDGIFSVFHPSLALIAVGTSSGLFVYSLDDDRSSEIPGCAKNAAVAGAASKDGSNIAIACRDGSIVLTDWDGRLRETLKGKGHRKTITSLSFSPNGSELASSGEDNAVIVWDVPGRREIARFEKDTKRPYVFAGFAAEGTSVVALTNDGRILEWNWKNQRLVRNSSISDNTIQSGAIDAAGKTLAIGSEYVRLDRGALRGGLDPSNLYREGWLTLYDLTRGSVVKEIKIDGRLLNLSFSADNRFVAATRHTARSGNLAIFDVQNGEQVFSQQTRNNGTLAQFSPDGQYLAGLAPEGDLSMFKVAGARQKGPWEITSATLPLIKSDAQLTLAAMDLDALSVEQDVGASVAAMIRTRIGSQPGITMIERARMQAVIKEQNIQNSDRTDSTTAVSLGRYLNVQKMIFGSVSALESHYTINIVLVDVETGVIDGIREAQCRICSLKDLPQGVLVLGAVIVEGAAE